MNAIISASRILIRKKVINMREKRSSWAGRINGIRQDFIDLPEYTVAATAIQLEVVDILIDQLNNHGLFSNILHHHGVTKYTISLRNNYPNSHIKLIRINFNRFNMSMMIFDASEDFRFGTFRFATSVGKKVECTLTSVLHYDNNDDESLVNELAQVFDETQIIYQESKKKYHSLTDEDNIDLDSFKFVDLCSKYTGNVVLKNKLARTVCDGIVLGTLSAREFYEKVDLDKLKRCSSIGNKSINIIKEMYKFYGLEKKGE